MVIRYRYATFDYSSTCRQRRNSRFGVIAINFRIERASAYVDRTKPLSYFGLILNMADVPTHAIIASNSRPHKQHQRVTLYAKNTHDLYAGAISDVVGRKADYFFVLHNVRQHYIGKIYIGQRWFPDRHVFVPGVTLRRGKHIARKK